MQTEVVETCHAVRIACPYCGKGTMHVQGTTVSVLSTGPTALEPLTDDADEQPRYECDTATCEHFIAASINGYINEEWHTERMPWLPETVKACRAMCEKPKDYLKRMKALHRVAQASVSTERGRLDFTMIFAQSAPAFVLELLPIMFPGPVVNMSLPQISSKQYSAH